MVDEVIKKEEEDVEEGTELRGEDKKKEEEEVVEEEKEQEKEQEVEESENKGDQLGETESIENNKVLSSSSHSDSELEMNITEDSDKEKVTESPSSDKIEKDVVNTDLDETFDEFQEETNDNFEEDDNQDDDFGDFDDFDELETAEPEVNSTFAIESERQGNFPCLSESDFSNSAQLQASVRLALKQMWPSDEVIEEGLESTNHGSINEKISVGDDSEQDTDDSTPVKRCTKPAEATTSPGSYFSERSASLWQQLVVDSPHSNPADWKKSSIRRLLLVSLGIPLDLDEILPNKNTKRLVLPMSTRRTSGDRHRDKKESKSTDNRSSTTATSSSNKKSEDEKEYLRQETETKLSSWHQLSIVSSEALEGMTEKELEIHVDTLKTSLIEAQSISTQWQELLQAALQDKETFEGVIESLLEYAQRLRTRSK